MRFRIGTLAVLAALAMGAPAQAQTVNFGTAAAVVAAACGKIVEANCRKLQPGDPQFSGCLLANATPACAAAATEFQANLDARFAAQAEAGQACRQDAQRLCSGFQEGHARILRCLMKPANFKAATPRCKNTLEAAGWLDEVSIKVR